MLPLIYLNIYQLSGKSTDHFEVNNAMFQRDLYEELNNADFVEIVNNQLWIYTGDDIIQYLYHNQRIIRKLNQEGYIIMLEGVKNAHFKMGDNAVFLSIERFNKHTITYQIICRLYFSIYADVINAYNIFFKLLQHKIHVKI